MNLRQFLVSGCVLVVAIGSAGGGWRKIIRRAPSRLSCRIPPVVRSTPSRGISAAAWPRRLGKPFLIENKTGGGTVVGTNAVAKATPDGYTLLMGSSTPLAINATLYKIFPTTPRRT